MNLSELGLNADVRLVVQRVNQSAIGLRKSLEADIYLSDKFVVIIAHVTLDE